MCDFAMLFYLNFDSKSPKQNVSNVLILCLNHLGGKTRLTVWYFWTWLHYTDPICPLRWDASDLPQTNWHFWQAMLALCFWVQSRILLKIQTVLNFLSILCEVLILPYFYPHTLVNIFFALWPLREIRPMRKQVKLLQNFPIWSCLSFVHCLNT